jgi:putative ABC transport system permease protein
MNQVQEVAYCSGNVPFSGNSFNTNIDYNGNEIFANIYSVENSFQNVLGIKLLEGRWFNRQDEVSRESPVVVNHILKKELFGDADVVGKIITTEASERMKIVGVVQAFKDESEAEVPLPGLFRRLDTLTMRYNIVMLIKVKPGADAAFESRVFKTLSNNLKSANIEIEHLTNLKDTANKRMQVPLIIFIIVAAFLIINVALGIFGVLWYNINKRKGEIGLRRAVGATGSAISRQLVGEAFLLCTLSLIMGLFFAVQLPLLGSFNLPRENYLQAIILALLFIYALVILCALYPGTQAARIYPAEALHED